MKNCALFSLTYKDAAFIDHGFFVALESLKKTNPDLPVFVFYDSLPESVLKKIKNKGATPILLNAKTYPDYADELNAIDSSRRPDLTKATWFKFFIGKLSGFGTFQKVLFLDSDLVVLDDINELFEIDSPFVAVYPKRRLDLDYKNPEKILKQEGIDPEFTLNGGVFVADIEYWIENDLTKRAFEIVDRYGVDEFLCADQGVLNILATRFFVNAVRIPSIYNFCRRHDMELSPQLLVRLNRKELRTPILNGKFIKIIHWNGQDKPWDDKLCELESEEIEKLYLECYEQFIEEDTSGIRSNKTIKVGVVTTSPLTRTETFINHHIKVLDAVHLTLRPTKMMFGMHFGMTKGYKFRSFIKRNGVNIVLAEFGPAALEIKYLCRELGLPLIVHFHGYDASRYDILAKYARAYEQLFKETFAIIVVSKAMEKKMLELGAPAEKILYNPCGVDTDVFYPASPDDIHKDFIFMFMGRFVEKKSPINTIKAFVKALPKMTGAKLIMYGGGPLLEDSKMLAKDLGVEASIKFKGLCRYKKVPGILRSADVYVQHSIIATDGDSEGMPVIILEAGACGLPVISTRHAGIPDVVIDQETGMLVDEGDVNGMAEAMVLLAKDKKRRIDMGKKAREHILSNYSNRISDAWLKKITQDAFQYGLKNRRRPKPLPARTLSVVISQYLSLFTEAIIRFRRTKELLLILNVTFLVALIFAWHTYGVTALLFSVLVYIIIVQLELFVIFRVLKRNTEYIKLGFDNNFKNLISILDSVKVSNQDKVQELEQRINSTKNDLSKRIETSSDIAEKKALHQVQDYLALISLLKPVLAPQEGLPYMMDYAVAPDFAKKVAKLILEKKPRVIVELGSGISTLISAYCLKINGSGKINSFDHLKEFTDKTESLIKTHGLELLAGVQFAPIESVKINDREYPWYSLKQFEKLESIDMLIVDGPPGVLSPTSRFPALPILFKKLSPGACIIIDDARREGEKQIIELWKKEFSNLEYQFIETERGMAVFTVGR